MSIVEKHDPINDLFVAQVRVSMKQNRISITELARRMGCDSRGYIYEVFNGEVSPTLDWVARCAQAIEMNVDVSLTRVKGAA